MIDQLRLLFILYCCHFDLERPTPYQQLREVDLEIIHQDECRKHYDHELTDNMFCTAAEGKYTCNVSDT